MARVVEDESKKEEKSREKVKQSGAKVKTPEDVVLVLVRNVYERCGGLERDVFLRTEYKPEKACPAWAVDQVLLEKKGLEYYRNLVADCPTWAEAKMQIDLDRVKKVLNLAEKDLREIWKDERKLAVEAEQYVEAERAKSLSGQFIFNEKLVVKPVVFSCHRIGNEFGYGFLLPKYVPIYSSNGKDKKIIGKEQVRAPGVITSDRRLIEPSHDTESLHKIKYIAIPQDLELRASLGTLKSFLENKTTPPNGKEIFESIAKTYRQFLHFQTEAWYAVHPLWDIGTYFFELFNTYPICELRGISGTAKSKVMKVSRLFTLNPTEIMINPSEASLFRITHTKRPTKYIDEAEKLFLFIGGQWQSSPTVELINGSYSRGSTVPRLEKLGNDYRIVHYQCYSPTMIGSIAGLRDATETRAITHIMTKAPDKDSRGELEVADYEDAEEFQSIRDKMYLYALGNFREVERNYRELAVDGLKKRDLQLWKPLLAVAKTIDEQIFNEILEFAKKQSAQRKDDFIPEGTTDFQILDILKDELNMHGNAPVYLKTVTEKYNTGKDKPIAPKTLSAHLDRLGFKEYRERDERGSKLNITKEIFEAIVSPICPSLSSYSSYSSYSQGKDNKKDDEDMTNADESNNSILTNLTNPDANDEYIEQGVGETCVNCKASNATFKCAVGWLCKKCAYQEVQQ